MNLIEIIKKKGIVLKMPETTFSEERIVIELYTKHLSEDELKEIEEELL